MGDGELPNVATSEARLMIDGWVAVPAFIRDRYLTIVASNALSTALSPVFREGVNLVRALFSTEELPENLRVDRQQIADTLRESVLRYEGDEDFELLVDEMSSMSPHFRAAWAGASETVEPVPFRVLHQRVGPISLAAHAMTMPGRSDLSLTVLRCTDDASRAALNRLADG